MNRQVYLKDEIQKFELTELEHQVQHNIYDSFKEIEKFSICNISIANSGLPIDRKLLYSWRQHDLLPFEKEKGKNWGRFSFIEICWLKLLLELRSVGIGIDKLKETKQFFFNEKFVKDYFESEFANFNKLPSQIFDKEKVDSNIKNGVLQFTDKVLKILTELQVSPFSMFLISTILSRANYCLIIDANKNMEVIDLNALINNTKNELTKTYDLLSEKTCVFINIRKIVTEISGTEAFFKQDLNIASIISKNALDVLKQLFVDSKVKEVTIRKIKENNTIVSVKKEMQFEDLQKQIFSLKKRGNFKDIIIKTRDGNVQYFELTEFIKI